MRRWSALGALFLAARLAVACAGHSVTAEGIGDGGPSDAGGAQGGSGAGNGNAGGAAACSSAGCTALSCDSGEQPRLELGACCPHCAPVCKQVCPALDCLRGSHALTLSGDCCPSCIPDPPDQACSDGRAAFATLFDGVVATDESLPCRADLDCTAVNVINDCVVLCETIAVLASQAAPLASTLRDAAAMDCGSCPATDSTCPSSPPPVCVDGRCAPFMPTLPR